MASNGYVLIRVGKEHPLSDVRGYAYEHRVIAEQKLGRPLKKGEIVHHKDGDKTNNSPDNIEVVASILAHAVHHRKRSDLRQIDEPNLVVACECGCGAVFKKFDAFNRPRRFLPSHNRRWKKYGGK